MHSAVSNLKLDHLFVIYPGQREIPFKDNISLVGLEGWTQKQAKICHERGISGFVDATKYEGQQGA